MATYRWTGNRPLRRNDGDDVEPGDEFEFDRDGDNGDDPIESAFGDLVERVDGDEDEDETDAQPGAGTEAAEQQEGGEGEAGDDIDDLLDGTVDDVEDELATGDYDDRLDEIAERADRAGVEDAVENRQG